MALSDKANRVMEVAMANKAVAKELGAAVDAATAAIVNIGAYKVAMVITATAVSTTTDFGALLVGDLVMKLPATPGTVTGGACSVLGTSPVTVAIGDNVVVLRAAV